MQKIPVSLQLWSLRDATKLDFAKTMADVAAIGFTGVETAGYGNLDAAGAAKAVADAGLKCSGMHVGLGALRADPVKVAQEAQLFGTRDIICPYFPRELLRSVQACQALGEELDAIGAHLRAFGLRLHYHNHDSELAQIDGRIGLDWLFDAARPANLLCQADVYWIKKGGKEPAEFIHEQGRRIRLVHLKDETELGTGPVEYPDVFDALDTVGAVEWYIIEVERYSFDPLESVRRSFAQLKAWGRA